MIPAKYDLQEAPSTDYGVRTRRNVIDSDGTLIIAPRVLAGGSLLTANVAQQVGRPLLILDVNNVMHHARAAGDALRAWLEGNEIDTLNIAGPRESDCPGIQDVVCRFLLHVLSDTATQ